ncbi:MAG TPA: ATP-binding protein [Gaiellaceae bacterium]|nr:ATP-binding protein [Gaiellaceae bacterium]
MPSESVRSRQWLGMRWWLGIAFASIAALTAIAVVRVLSSQSEDAFRASAVEFAVGNSVAAADALADAATPAAQREQAETIARNRGLSLFLFDEQGRLVASGRAGTVRFAQIPSGEEALATALDRRRYIGGSEDGSATVVGLSLRGPGASALVAYTTRPELREQLGIVRDEVAEAALWATLLGAAAGLIVATLFARRIARIARTARAIETGDFSTPVVDRFPDEVGSLATSIDRMRLRLDGLIATLREDRDRFEGLVDRLNDGVLLLDRSRRITFANAAVSRVLPARSFSVGSTLDEVWDDPRLTDFTDRLFGDEGGAPAPLLLESDDRLVAVSGVPAGHGGESAILVLADVTQQERDERAQREFVTNAAHELRTPIAGIVTSIEMLQTGAKDDPRARDDFLAHIERESGRLARLTRALLVLARAEARQEEPHRENVHVAPLLQRVAASLEPRGPVRVRVECDPALVVPADPDLLEQAVQSVAQNADKYTERGEITLRAYPSADGVAVEVEDTGHGIAPAERDRIFERFYRGAEEEPGGFGLGLAIARQAVKVLGGAIELDATPEGTTVRLLLPTATRAAA